MGWSSWNKLTLLIEVDWILPEWILSQLITAGINLRTIVVKWELEQDSFGNYQHVAEVTYKTLEEAHRTVPVNGVRWITRKTNQGNWTRNSWEMETWKQVQSNLNYGDDRFSYWELLHVDIQHLFWNEDAKTMMTGMSASNERGKSSYK